MLSLCNGWEFAPEWFDGFALGEGAGEGVRLPHTVVETPLHYTDHQSYQMVCGYRRKLELGEELTAQPILPPCMSTAGKRLITAAVIPLSGWRSQSL